MTLGRADLPAYSIWLIYIYYTVSFRKDNFSQGAVNEVFFLIFLMFLPFFDPSGWAFFHFGIFGPQKKKS